MFPVAVAVRAFGLGHRPCRLLALQQIDDRDLVVVDEFARVELGGLSFQRYARRASASRLRSSRPEYRRNTHPLSAPRTDSAA